MPSSHAPPPTDSSVPSQSLSFGYFRNLKLPAFVAEHDVIWHGIALWSVGVNCPGCVLSLPLTHPQAAGWEAARETEKALMLGKCCSAITETSLYYQHWSQIQNTAPYGLWWGKVTPSQPDLVHSLRTLAFYGHVFRHTILPRRLGKVWAKYLPLCLPTGLIQSWCSERFILMKSSISSKFRKNTNVSLEFNLSGEPLFTTLLLFCPHLSWTF